jgi:Protein of unknown function DUF2625
MMIVVVVIRRAENLTDFPDPAWPPWLGLAASAQVTVVAVPGSCDTGLEVPIGLQVTAGSMLGAVALNSGRLRADHRDWRLFSEVCL